ncbi:outer membrane beta-barrel protein [Chenggangzhangella methanolivorans]|uniref:Outer membrane beta-barrel protein n=1 Tax=Chenggangzhangella methanolivorans TaxID=1437009 RepID=A0A9E6UPA6_9HYPH|nr:outer membrane beta-barrel protein [Chenggangzhangella methanolivorans]QZO01204.1 outer membrane beta-barrel protein [Chenggangzhangella methanolivorans]
MSRRAIFRAVLLASAVAVVGDARAQSSGEPLRRLDERTLGLPVQGGRPAAGGRSTPQAATQDGLAGGDYGQTPASPTPLAGGDFGVEPADPGTLAGGGYGEPATPEGEGERTAPIAPSYLADPLAAGPGGFDRTRLRRPASPVDDAYAPTGVTAGAFTLRPSLETAAGYDDNPNRVDGSAKGSGFVRLKGELDAQSNWSRHALDFESSAQIRRYESVRPGYEPDLNAALSGRLDISERTQINAQLRGSVIASQPGDPETSGIKGDEISRSVGATLGVAQRFNRLSLRLDGLVDRYTVKDSKLTNPDPVTGDDMRDNSDRAYNSYQARLRASYDLSPKLQPFVETSVDTRDYDQKIDNTGLRHLGSDGFAVGGAQFEAGRLVTGELGLGYGRQTPKDGGLKPVEGVLIDGNVAWTPTALTTVRGTVRTSLQETSLVNSSGILDRSGELSIEHQFRRNFIGTARLAFDRAEYKGGAKLTQDQLTAGLGFEYKINRNVALTGKFDRVWMDSTAQGADYVASIVEFGLKFRR